MDLEKVKKYLKDKTIREGAEHFGVSYFSMAHYVKYHNIEHIKVSMKGASNGNYRHGYRHKRIYHIWLDMRQRCFNPRNKAFKNYGARNIIVCEEWNNFSNFVSWALAHGYTEELTIDRINVNGNYCPENCRWITRKEQALNTRRNRFFTYKGKTQTLMEWAKELGMHYDKLRWRVDNWKNIEDCFKK